MKEKIINLLKENNVVIPKLLLLNYKQLKMNEKELILVIYLINMHDLTFNPKKISNDMNLDLEDVMTNFETLISKDFIKLDNLKINGVRTEKINMDNLYVKLSHLIIVEDEQEKETSIYSVFEEKFGRTLSPMEYTIIGGWLDMKFSEEIITLALEEAIYNGVYKLNYIDKILYEWNKKGIKNREDKEKNDTAFKNKKVEKKELYDYNWLEENE